MAGLSRRARAARMFASVALALCALGLAPGTANAQEPAFPARPIRFVVGFAAGGGVDRGGPAVRRPALLDRPAGRGGEPRRCCRHDRGAPGHRRRARRLHRPGQFQSDAHQPGDEPGARSRHRTRSASDRQRRTTIGDHRRGARPAGRLARSTHRARAQSQAQLRDSRRRIGISPSSSNTCSHRSPARAWSTFHSPGRRRR